MRRFISAAVTLLTLMFMLPVFAVTASAVNTAQGWSGDTSLSGVGDEAGVFTKHPESLDILNEEVRETAEKLQLNIYVLLAGPEHYMADSATPAFCDEAYDRRFGNDTDGVYFFIDMSGKRPAYDYISTSGKAILFYDGKTDTIREATYEYLPSSDEGNYDEHYFDVRRGVECFLSGLEKYQSEFRSGMKYYYDKDTHKYIYYIGGELHVTNHKPPVIYLKALIIGLVGGGIVNLIAFFIGKKNYKFKGKTDPNIYLSKEESRFSTKDDIFINSHTSRTHIPQSSGGSGGGHRSGGGGGGGFHGGSHGGSGGHR
ncbi:MAG: hypothetical protein Q4A05_03945 [Ruminococcus sp.]|nr:hypothetical protein [Ruminococcus sp.]